MRTHPKTPDPPMRLLTAGLLLFTLALPAGAQTAYEPTFTRVLEAVVADNGMVRYAKLGQPPHRARLDSVLNALRHYELSRLDSDAARKAFWINAYNALMLDAVQRQPSRRNVLGGDEGAIFFKTPREVGGLRVTLDQIENVVLRRQPGPASLTSHRVARLDPRIHVALNCAAISCPRLRPVALTPANLDAQLDAGMRDFTASPRHFRVTGGQIVLSSLLDWFGGDFDTHAPAGEYLLRFMPTSRPGYVELRALLAGRNAEALRAQTRAPRGPKVVFDYDWTVNRASPDR